MLVGGELLDAALLCNFADFGLEGRFDVVDDDGMFRGELVHFGATEGSGSLLGQRLHRILCQKPLGGRILRVLRHIRGPHIVCSIGGLSILRQ